MARYFAKLDENNIVIDVEKFVRKKWNVVMTMEILLKKKLLHTSKVFLPMVIKIITLRL